MPLIPHSTLWYDRLSTLQPGYYYDWRSHLEPWHGEDNFRELIFQHLRSDLDVLEVACAQGELALETAPRVRSVLGYDRIEAWIERARHSASERGVKNVTFIQHDSSAAFNCGRPHVPAPDQAFDLVICSKGPFHWIEDVRRVARPGAVLLMLVPANPELTPWTASLPEALRWQGNDPDWPRTAIEQRLAGAHLSLHSWWSIDVPEIFASPQDLYVWRTWGTSAEEVPSFAESAADIERIFQQFAGPSGLAIRRLRYIWKAVIPNKYDKG